MTDIKYGSLWALRHSTLELVDWLFASVRVAESFDAKASHSAILRIPLNHKPTTPNTEGWDWGWTSHLHSKAYPSLSPVMLALKPCKDCRADPTKLSFLLTKHVRRSILEGCIVLAPSPCWLLLGNGKSGLGFRGVRFRV